MRILDKVTNLGDTLAEIRTEEEYVNWVRKWKIAHESVVDLISHHKSVMNFHRDEWRIRRVQLHGGMNNPKHFIYAFDDGIEGGATRNNQRWKAIYGNVAREMYEMRSIGKQFIREWLSKNETKFRRQEASS